jgi:hypothetical protein
MVLDLCNLAVCAYPLGGSALLQGVELCFVGPISVCAAEWLGKTGRDVSLLKCCLLAEARWMTEIETDP